MQRFAGSTESHAVPSAPRFPRTLGAAVVPVHEGESLTTSLLVPCPRHSCSSRTRF